MKRKKKVKGELSGFEVVAYGLGGFGATLQSVFIASFASFFMTDYVGINASVVGTMLLLITLFDAVNDPIIGRMADRNHSRIGKYRPYLLIGGIGLPLFTFLRFTAPNFGTTGTVVFFFLIMVAWSIFSTMFHMPWQAMNAILSRDVHERNRLLTSRQMLGFIASLIASAAALPIINAFGGERQGYTITAGIFAAIMLACFLLNERGVHRVDQPGLIADPPDMNWGEQLSIVFKNKVLILAALIFGCYALSYGITTTANMYYFTHVVGQQSLMTIVNFAGFLSVILIVPFMGKLIRKFGKKAMILFGLAVMSARPIAIILFGANIGVPAVIALSIISMLGGGIANFTALSLVPDATDYTEYKFGSANAGFINAIMQFMKKLEGSLASFLPGILLGAAGYSAAMAATPQVQRAILSITGWLPALVAAIGAVLVYFYPLGTKKHKEMLDELNAIRAEKGALAAESAAADGPAGQP